MAYTRIHAIKTTLNKALDYIENPDKTDEQLLVSGYNVDPLTASIDFEMTAALSREIKGDYTKTGGGDNLAYHMIQSFAKFDKLTPEQAHEIGKKWADEVLQGKYEYVVSTHIDKGHIHNHIIFNSTSFYDYKKFETVHYKTAQNLRKISDRICDEHGLYVIRDPKGKGKSHYEWQQRKNGTSWKVQIEKIIDGAIEKSQNYEEFKDALKAENVAIKEGKRISFCIVGTGQERYCRGDRIGEDYTRERIIERLSEPKERGRAKERLPKQEQPEANRPQQGAAHRERQPVFSSYDKKVEWQARQTRLSATKELAEALLTIRREDIQQENDFGERVAALSDQATGVKDTIRQLDDKNLQYKDAAKYLLAYNRYLPIRQELDKQNVFSRKGYEKKYESELLAFSHAAAQLDKISVNTNVDPDKVINLVKDQDSKISDLSAALQEVTGRIGSIRKAYELVQRIQQEQGKEQERSKEKGQEI